MKKINISNTTIIALLVLSGIISWHSFFKTFTQSDTVNIHLFPKTIGEWTSTELPITDEEYAILETKNAFVRKYSHPGKEDVYLFIVYSHNNRKVSHPPEICYTGSGVDVLGNKKVTVHTSTSERTINVNQLKLEKGPLKEIAFYWFKVGHSYTSNYWKQQALIAMNFFLGRPSSSAIIRVSSDIQDSNEESAVMLLKSFTAQILPHLKLYLK